MFLLEIWEDYTRPSTTPDHRISDERAALTHYWDAVVSSVSSITYSLDHKYGGLVRPTFGTISLFPDVVDGDFLAVDIYYTNTTEAARLLLFSGYAYINNRTMDEVVFDLFTDMPNVQLTSDLDYTTGYTLISVFQDYCTTFGWTLDSSLARSTDINLSFIAKSGTLQADMLAELAATYSHYFVLDTLNTTLYLRDAYAGAGSTVILDEFDFFPSKYPHDIPAAKVTVENSSSSQTSYGSPYFFGSQEKLTAYSNTDSENLALADRIKTIYNSHSYTFALVMPMEYVIEKGISFINKNKIQWTDTNVDFGLSSSPTISMIMQNMTFSSDKEQGCVISGLVTLS